MESNTNKNVSDAVAKVLNRTRTPFYLLVVFFVVYLVVFIGSGNGLRSEGNESNLRITFDCIFVSLVLAYITYNDFSMTPAARQKFFTTDYLDFFDDDLSLFSLMLFLVCFYLLVFLMGITIKPMSVVLIEGITWILLATLIIHNCLKNFFKVNILDSFRKSTLTDASGNVVDASGNLVDASGNIIVKIALKTPEVFNIPDNLYRYEDAQAICKVYDSRLATYDELEQSYENGAEWCNYGWSAEQMAFFPTQKKTWDELQKTDKNKNNCGRPGINGGFFKNPHIKFGVNCFGIKPDADKDDLTLMKSRKDRPIPKTDAEKKLDEKVEYWKKHKSEMMNISSFNRDKWSRY